ncbi:beta strand repeat-containing protein [Psychroserpens ponticola]|uniref:T9SS type A sorting domain-containing protein n=1 Tax=Psychroserpens ponticola TaxID=2932268 RepID=A0ABY7RVJ7_9FLAO|nr:T9SS type A sorting domain-containing protein [Psychroserpens ponticola]WCO01151.1 T9SS type A sorting domain-containing protein [Psychroserpens ponticola]
MKHIYTLLLALMMTALGFGQTTVTYDFSDGGAVTGLNEASPGITVDSDPNIGFGSFKNSGTSNPALNSGQLRLYQNATKGGSIIIYANSGVTITNIIVNASSLIGDAGYIVDGGSQVNLSGGSTYTISGISSTSQVEFFQRESGSGNRIYVDTFDVTYTSGGGGCTAPTTQASVYNTTSIGTTSATLNWTDGDGDEVLVLVKAGSAVDADPTNGTGYTGNTVFTSGDQIGTGNYVVQSGSATSSVSITGLTAATTYHVAVYEYNTTDTCYELTELTGNFTTGCSTPSDVTAFTATAGNTEVDLSWTNGSCFDEILVVAKATSAVTVTPTGDGTAYTANAAFGSGTDLGTSEYAVYKGSGTSVTITGLTNGTTYHFEAFARKVTTWSSGVTDSAAPIDQLGAGDIAFTAFNADGGDEFSFVALADIPANTTIWFTDNEWDGNSFNNINEGEIEWSHTSTVTAGSVIIIEDTSGGSPTVNIGSVSGGSVNLGASDEQLFALLSTPSASTMATPGFLAGISNDLTGSTLTGTGLTDGTDFLDFDDDGDGYEYTGSRSSESAFADYLPLIMNTTNWQIETSNGNNILPISTTVFTLASGCTAPTTQASAYNTTSIGSTSATLNWTSGNGDEVMVVVKESSAVDMDPTDGTAYTGNTVFTSGDQIGTGNYVVQSGSATSSVSITGLTAATTYHVAVYEYNTTGTCYELTELTGNFTTDCPTPSDVTTFTATSGDTTIDLSWTNGSCFDDILVVAKATSAVTVTPTGDGTAYTANTVFGSGTDLGTNEYAVYKGTGTSVTVTGLTNGTTYHFTAFARKTTTWSAGVTDSATPNTVEEAVAGDLIITEVSGDGSATGNDNGYMEIYNRSNKIINLDNIEARYFNSNPGSSTQQVTLSGTLSPGSFVIVTQNAGNYTTEYSDTADATGSDFYFNGGDDGCDVYHTTNGVIDQFNDNGSGQSPWNWSDSFTYYRNSTGSGAIEDNWTQDGTDNPRSKTNLFFWTGASDSSWTNTSNWDEAAAPSSTTDVVITDQTNEPSITTSVEVSNITIETSTDIIVEKTGNLEVSGNLNNSGNLSLESDSNEYSSLIIDGTSNGTINYERHVNINGSGTTGSNDLISAPLTGQQFDDFATANSNILSNGAGTLFLFGPFDKTSGEYLTYADTETATLDAGVGYRAASDDNGTFTFTGTANNGTITNDIINSGPSEPAESEWNLVGNPYPSYINVQDFLNHEVSSGISNLDLFDAGTAAIYGYDGNALNGWTVYNLANTTASTVIAPGQGFFVSADATYAPLYDLEFSPTIRSTGTTDDFIAGRSGGLTHFTLQASSAADSYSTEFYFNPIATRAFDLGHDAEIFSINLPFVLYSHLVEEDEGAHLTLQALNTTDLMDVTIPIGINANQGVQVTFTMSLNELPENHFVYFIDTVENTTTLLNDLDYVLTPSTALSGIGRFYIRVSEVALSTIENSFNELTIFALNESNEIVVNGQLQKNTILNLYDIQGRKVLSTQLDNTSLENRIDISSLSGGVYVVNVQNNEQQKSQKVIIK